MRATMRASSAFITHHKQMMFFFLHEVILYSSFVLFCGKEEALMSVFCLNEHKLKTLVYLS